MNGERESGSSAAAEARAHHRLTDRFLLPIDRPDDVVTCRRGTFGVNPGVFTATARLLSGFSGLCGCGRDPRTRRAAMGFYGTLKLIFYKVSIDDRSVVSRAVTLGGTLG